MKTRLIAVALLASAALIAPLQAGGGNHGGGGGGNFSGGGRAAARGGAGPSFGAVPAGRFGGGPAFRSMPMRSFGANPMIYSGQRFSSVGPRSSGSMEFRPRTVNSNAGSVRAHQFAQGHNNRVDRGSRFANSGKESRNGSGTLRSDWRNHVVAQHSANWHHDWDRHHDHFFHHHRFVFIDGFWWGFGLGWDPWWWDYPYDYYGYGYPYPDSYGYDPGYYDSNAYSDDDSGYVNQSGNSTVAAVQERLAQEGYYRGQVDGVFGPGTRAALAEYQSNRGLRVTGALTNETLAALGLRQVASY